MRFLPVILAVLSLPAGFVGYVLGGWLIGMLPLPEQTRGLIGLFAPLFVGGLFMLPFLVPFIDRKARQDLAAHRAHEAEAAKVRAQRGGRR